MGSRVPVPEPGSSTPSFSLTKTKHPVTTMADQKELEEAFKLFDADGDGLITSVELKALVEKVGGCMSEGEAQGLIHQADRDGNAAIDMSEFTKLWAAIRGDGQEEDVIRTEFRKIDKDNSGFITKDEMMSIITSSGAFVGDAMAEAQKCVAELDVDKDGRVSYPEFLLVYKYKKA